MTSIEDALKRAFWHVKVPSMTMLLMPLLLYVIFARLRYIPSVGNDGLLWFGIAFFISIFGGWLIWSVQVPRWRLWSYRRVENIAQLKEAAMDKQIIWPEGSFFQKTEWVSKNVWNEIKRLEDINEEAACSE